MKITIDLKGIGTGEQLLEKLGDVFELGGPDGNTHVMWPAKKSGWGMNWDALEDSLCSLEKGGIWGTSKKLAFPLELEILNGAELQNGEPESWETFKDIMKSQQEKYALVQKTLMVTYV